MEIFNHIRSKINIVKEGLATREQDRYSLEGNSEYSTVGTNCLSTSK